MPIMARDNSNILASGAHSSLVFGIGGLWRIHCVVFCLFYYYFMNILVFIVLFCLLILICFLSFLLIFFLFSCRFHPFLWILPSILTTFPPFFLIFTHFSFTFSYIYAVMATALHFLPPTPRASPASSNPTGHVAHTGSRA